MYKFLNAESTAVVHLPTSRCIYLDQPATIHSAAYGQWLTEGNTTASYVAPPAPPELPLADQKAALLVKIDTDADAIYGAVTGNRATEYQQAFTDATAYKAAGYTGTVPSCVQSWATAKSQTATWAADDILATAADWNSAQSAIRANRLLRKENAKTASDSAALNTVKAQWLGFVAVIRGQLGLPPA